MKKNSTNSYHFFRKALQRWKTHEGDEPLIFGMTDKGLDVILQGKARDAAYYDYFRKFMLTCTPSDDLYLYELRMLSPEGLVFYNIEDEDLCHYLVHTSLFVFATTPVCAPVFYCMSTGSVGIIASDLVPGDTDDTIIMRSPKSWPSLEVFFEATADKSLLA